MHEVITNIWLMAQAIWKVLWMTGLGFGIAFAVFADLYWSRREQRKEPAKVEMIDVRRPEREAA